MKKMGTLSPGLGVCETALKMPAPPIGLTSSGRVQDGWLLLGDACTVGDDDTGATGPAPAEEGGALGCTGAETLAAAMALAGVTGGAGVAAAAPHAASRTPSAAASCSLPDSRLRFIAYGITIYDCKPPWSRSSVISVTYAGGFVPPSCSRCGTLMS